MPYPTSVLCAGDSYSPGVTPSSAIAVEPVLVSGYPEATARNGPVGQIATRSGTRRQHVWYSPTELAPPDQNISTDVLIGYTQASAADVRRAIGIDRRPAHERVSEGVQAARS
jgi:hypothetical protein